jgi:sec-independent protein translocase protein TatA
MPFNIGPFEAIVVLVIILLVVGPGRLPDVGASLGKTIREFRKASTEITEATTIDMRPEPRPASAKPVAARPAASAVDSEPVDTESDAAAEPS